LAKLYMIQLLAFTKWQKQVWQHLVQHSE